MTKSNYEEQCKFMRNSVTLDNHPKVEGYDFEESFNFSKFLDSFENIGFQASKLGYAMKLVNKMIDDDASILLSMTGNTISSGLREIILFLVKNKCIKKIVTSAAGVEEDLVKCFKHFVIGDFDIPGKTLFESGVGRIGNILVPFDRYVYFEKFVDPLLEEIHAEHKEKAISTSELIKYLALKLDNKESYLYWAAKNDIKIYCPAIDDGAFGDLLYFFRQKHPDFIIDTLSDKDELINYTIGEEKLSAILLGGGTSKHYLLNANILREGLDSAVYLTTAHEFDGSDSGGNQEEAKTWAKIKVNAPTVKVIADFTITFPLLVAATFGRRKHEKSE